MTTQTLIIRGWKDHKWGVAHFDIDNGPDHLRNYRWPDAWNYLLNKGMRGYQIEQALRKALDYSPDPNQLTLEV